MSIACAQPRPAERAARPRHYLQTGRLFVASGACEVTTILGTCVAVCLWDARAGVGGVSHFLLPYPVEGALASPRFGKVAVDLLLAELRRLAGDAARLQAKVFGGVRSNARTGGEELGDANAKLAFSLLQSAGIPVVASDVGGEHARKLIFTIPEGEARVHYL